MRYNRPHSGSLTLATSRPGLKVKCVHYDQQGFHRFWTKYTKKQWIVMPKEFAIYVVLAHATGNPNFEEVYRTGLVLTDKHGMRMPNPQINFGNGYGGEIYFPFSWFSVA